MRTTLALGMVGLLWAGCSGGPSGGTSGGATAGSTGGSTAGSSSGGNGSAPSLIGTWDLTTTPGGGSTPSTTTVVVGQDSLSVTGQDFTFSAVRSSATEAYTDNSSGSVTAVNATQTAASFNAGIIPFNLGGTWTIVGGTQGGAQNVRCTASLSASEIDGTCSDLDFGNDGPTFVFSFTTSKTQPGSSVLGDFGGTWLNTWYGTTSAGTDAGAEPCTLDFSGSNINTCLLGPSILSNITFSYNGNTLSGTAQGGEFSATRQ